MNTQKPSGAPECWGRLYQDGERECNQCRFRIDCKSETLYQINKPGARVPAFGNYSPPPVPTAPSPATTMVPLPSVRSPYAPVIPAVPQPVAQIINKPTITTTPPVQTAYHNSSYSIPNPSAPNPLTPWLRPGAPGPAYYFAQHSQEGVGSRLIKNTILRALEAIFNELAYFFRHWTWPPKP